jgi:CheY-like chemotaxis protein
MSNKPLSLLLVEDDELDIEMFRRAAGKRGLDEVELRFASDGAAALEMLRTGSDGDDGLQAIVVLDLNMPGMNGHEFLEELRMDTQLRRTIVFVLTSSDHQRDIGAAHDRNVAGYFLKSEINSFMATISHYLASARYPSKGNPCRL